jgi:hypothetical protein
VDIFRKVETIPERWQKLQEAGVRAGALMPGRGRIAMKVLVRTSFAASKQRY